jgi:uncharacterized membrane protein YhaH (DUF805 family)
MRFCRLFFSVSGRLRPGPFAVAAVLIYVIALAAHLLTLPAVASLAGLWPFAVAQALLIWTWFALHAKRLRDASRGIAPAQGIAAIYALAMALLILVGAFFLDGAAAPGVALPGSVLVLRQLFDMFRASLDPLTILTLIAFSSLVIVPIFSVWAGTRPSQAADTA